MILSVKLVNIINSYKNFSLATATYLGPCQTSMMKFLCENSEQLFFKESSTIGA